MKIFIWGSFLLLGFSSCQSWDQRLTLINKSEHTIFYWVTCDSSYKNIQLRQENKLLPDQSIKPYLLYGPEGKGPEKNPWVNAINLAADTSLHIFCYYVDLLNDLNGNDNLVDMKIKRLDLKVDSLNKLGWVVRYY